MPWAHGCAGTASLRQRVFRHDNFHILLEGNHTQAGHILDIHQIPVVHI